MAFLGTAEDENPGNVGTWVVRTSGRPQEAFHALKETVAAVNPSFVLEFKVMTEQIAESLQRDRLMAVLAGGVGGLAGGGGGGGGLLGGAEMVGGRAEEDHGGGGRV